MSTSFRRILLTSAALFVTGPVFMATAHADAPAQSAASGTDAAPLEEIVVTARNRAEKLKDVPISISAVSAATLDKLDLTSTNAIANYTPSLQFSDFAPGYFNGRLQARPIIFRGLNLSNNYGVTAASLVFLDGAPLLGSEIPAGLPIERVEVLRGPQSVYFGRSTLSGAVNYVTKDIGNDWTGDVEAEFATYNTKSIKANVSGAIIPDKLMVGLTGNTDSNDGYYTNGFPGGQALGARKTNSIAGEFELKPIDNLNIKGLVNYFQNDDGPAATVQLGSSMDNCKIGGTNNYYCGALPSASQLGFYSVSTIPAAAANTLWSGNLFHPGLWDAKYGVQRDALLMHLIVTYDFGFATAESRTAYEHDQSIGSNEGTLEPYLPTSLYKSYAFSLGDNTENFSQELRLRSSGDGPLRWTAGTSYVRGTDFTQAIVYYDITGVGPGNYNSGVGGNRTRSYGTFGGVYYDILDNLTASVEARYQWDARANYASNGVELAKIFKSFSPRVALDYKITPDVSAYVSYSKGTRPGGFNGGIVPYLNNALVLGQLTSQLGPIDLAYREETLKNYEIGVKGTAFENTVHFDTDFYYGELDNQQVTNYAFIPAISNTLGGTGNIGQTNIWGVEADGGIAINRMITLNGTFAWNHSDIIKYLCTSCTAYIGTTNVDGKMLGEAPEFSGSLTLDLHDKLMNTQWNWYSDVAYVYRGKTYIDSAPFNYQSIPARNTVDLRAGVVNDSFNIEGYITNLTNDKTYTSGNGATDFSTGKVTAFTMGVPAPRIFGARVKYSF